MTGTDQGTHRLVLAFVMSRAPQMTDPTPAATNDSSAARPMFLTWVMSDLSLEVDTGHRYALVGKSCPSLRD